MEKKTGHILSAVVVAAAIGGLFWQNAGLQDKVDQLSQQVSSLSNQLVDTRYDLSDDIDTLRRDMDEENSLFSSVETGLGYIGGDLSLSVSLVPKELSVGETAQLSLSTGETAVLTDDGSGRLTGVLTCPLRESLEPVVILTDGETTRREVLPTLWTNELFTMRGNCDWVEEEEGRSDLIRLEVDAPDAADLRLQTLTVEVCSSVLDPAAPGSLVGSVAAVRGSDGSWTADIRQYLDTEEEYSYDFWLTAVAEGGLPLRSEQPVADCQQNGQGGSCGSGSFTLSPDLS